MKKYGEEIDSEKAWNEMAKDYADALQGNYHDHRLSIVRALIPAQLKQPGTEILDFGCGDAVLFPEFLEAGARISGLDISHEMIDLAHHRLRGLGVAPELAKIGGVEALRSLPDASLDGVLSFNVLAYLTDEEEQLFYQQARRILRPGGYLVVTHSNELFDLFSLNRYSVNFMTNHLLQDKKRQAALPGLLSHADEPAERPTYNVRENPLSYGHKLASLGFKEIRQEFINLHVAPPLLLGEGKQYPDTLAFAEADRWKLMFICSTFGSCSIRI